MERPGIEPPLCAQSTNRSLYAIYSQIPVDNRVTLHRRMTDLVRMREGRDIIISPPANDGRGSLVFVVLLHLPAGDEYLSAGGVAVFEAE
jgi:hypothetical protein